MSKSNYQGVTSQVGHLGWNEYEQVRTIQASDWVKIMPRIVRSRSYLLMLLDDIAFRFFGTHYEIAWGFAIFSQGMSIS